MDHEEAHELAERFRASELGRRAARATRIEREFDFLFDVEDVVLRGQIDLWFEEAGELIVVDYKTDREEVAGSVCAAVADSTRWRSNDTRDALPDRAILYYLRSGQSRRDS